MYEYWIWYFDRKKWTLLNNVKLVKYKPNQSVNIINKQS
jgi:hypothetical protein